MKGVLFVYCSTAGITVDFKNMLGGKIKKKCQGIQTVVSNNTDISVLIKSFNFPH